MASIQSIDSPAGIQDQQGGSLRPGALRLRLGRGRILRLRSGSGTFYLISINGAVNCTVA